MKIKAEQIANLKPGTRIIINGERFIRMADSQAPADLHIEQYLFNPETGGWKHWSRLVLWSEEVEVE